MGSESLMKKNSEVKRKLSSLLLPFMCNTTSYLIIT